MPKDQAELAGMERPKIKAIEEAAEAYVQARDRRMKLTEAECAAKAKLIDVVQKNIEKLAVNGEGQKVYRYDETLVLLTDKINVKVKSAHADDDDDE